MQEGLAGWKVPCVEGGRALGCFVYSSIIPHFPVIPTTFPLAPKFRIYAENSAKHDTWWVDKSRG